MSWNIAPRSSVLGFAWGGLGNFVATAETYNSYEAKDDRRNSIFPPYYTNEAGDSVTINQPTDKVFIAQKWTPEGMKNLPVYVGDDNNQQILRYADVLLIYAEALNEQSGPSPAAYEAINTVRKRARLAPLSGLSQATFREAVYQERRHEFLLEGKRFFDLVRTGRFVPVMSKVVPGITEANQYLPIPQSETDLNPNLK